MQLSAERDSWTFGDFDLDTNTATPLAILKSTVTTQTFANDTETDPLAFSATLSPPLDQAPEDLSPLYDSASAKTLGDDELWPLYEAALRIENPSHHSPDSVDCVSCHTAQPARRWLDRNTALDARQSSFRFQSDLDLTVTEASDETTALRAFGWRRDRPGISARVVNESAAVASYLNERLMR
jgi:hypothetical protein